MSYLINNEQKLNDLIFANRNKAYGAYAIRSSYGETVFKSLSMMVFGVGSIIGTAYFLTHQNSPGPTDSKLVIIEHDSVYVIPVHLKPEEKILPEEKKIIEPLTPPAKPISNALSTNINDTVLTSKSDTSLTFETNTVKDTSTSGTESAVTKNNFSSGQTTDTILQTSIKSNFEVDTQPEFEGGLNALNKFIASHLKYPELAWSEGQEGKVYVRFVVDEKGYVNDLYLLNRAGYGMDEEALRVVGLIPKFKTPAKVKGHAVKAYYQVPIRFKYRY